MLEDGCVNRASSCETQLLLGELTQSYCSVPCLMFGLLLV